MAPLSRGVMSVFCNVIKPQGLEPFQCSTKISSPSMEGAFEVPLAPPAAGSAGDSPGGRLGVAAVAAVAVAAVVAGVLLDRTWFHGVETVPTQELSRLSVSVAPGQHLSGGIEMEEQEAYARQRPSRQSFVLSPDGRQLIYAASDGETTRLYRRPMDREQATPIPETEGGSNPFVAPDGRAVGFFVGTELKRVSLDGGEVRSIAITGPELYPFGASWTAEDTILVSADDGIFEVPANGGDLRRLTTPEPMQHVLPPLYPELLPGGRAVLFNVPTDDLSLDEFDIVVESLETGERHLVVEGGTDPRYVATGHVVFARRGTLMAVPFDITRFEVTDAPVVVVEDVMQAAGSGHSVLDLGAGQFSVSRSGALAYVPGGIYPANDAALVWMQSGGSPEPLPLLPGSYSRPRWSRDGSRLAYTEGGDIWVYDTGLEAQARLTSPGTNNTSAVWSPDGMRLAFASTRDGTLNLFVTAADGSGEVRPVTVTDGELLQMASSWSSGDVLAFTQLGSSGVEWDIMTVSMDGESEAAPFLATPFNEAWPVFSPDGRWLAYASDETREEASSVLDLATLDGFDVWVRPFPEGEPAHRISTDGGEAPLWSPDGRQLFYRRQLEDGTWSVMVVDVETDATFTRNQPRTLVEGPFGVSMPSRSYDVAPDGRRFVLTSPNQVEAQPVTSIHIVLNWAEELERLVPTDQ